MARIRTIKPEFWRSPDIMQLDLFQRLLYIGMWNLSDDEGRGEYNPAAIAADLFLTEYSLNPHGVLTQVENAFTEYSNRGMIRLYRVKKRDYFEIINWRDHQRINRPSASKFPSFDQQEQEIHAPLTEDSLNAHGGLTGGREQGSGNRDQGKEHELNDLSDSVESNDSDNSDSPKPAPKKNEYPDDFKAFWKVYPKKTGKIPAFEAWKKAKRKASVEEIIAGAHRYANDPNRDPGYTKNAQGWLNDGRWMDEPLPPKNQQPAHNNFQRPQKETAAEMYARLNGQPQTPPQPAQDYAQGHEIIDMGTDGQLAVPATQGGAQAPTLTFPRLGR